MDQSAVIRLFIDWGFTRLKLWICDGEGTLLCEQSTYTATLAKRPAFYDSRDLDQVCMIIGRALHSCLPAKIIHVYTSSQMHALAGSLNGHSDFVSTWNDLPIQPATADSVLVKDGIPVLNSMPVNKVIHDDQALLLSSSSCSRSQESLNAITSLSSPIGLLLHRIFQVPVPCSRSWWQSTCLPSDYLALGSLDQTCYLSESPLYIQPSYARRLLGIDSLIVIYPEVGDLQALTYSSVRQCQVMLNLGTGSQVILPSLSVSEAMPYFRYYIHALPAIPTLSHVPCGRLLADYVTAKNISFSILRQAMDELTPAHLVSNCQRISKTLLCFSGFSFHDCNYHQHPTTTLSELASLNPDVFLSLWVFQYYRIIDHFLLPLLGTTDFVTINIVGDLGGLADSFSALLFALLPPQFQLCRLAALTLPCSLLQFHVDSAPAAC